MQIIHGDSYKEVANLKENSIDAIVCDPPYMIGFMGKEFDKPEENIAGDVKFWKLCLRVLKPGGHLLAFSGTRTYHRMAVAIEDAGFEVRDMLEWIYASGFPKSLNIGKAVDKLQGNEREVIGKKPYSNMNIKGEAGYMVNDGTNRVRLNETKGNSEWEGFGTALKPAHEPICMARKPLECKTIVENVLKHGTGAIQIDGCRIPTSEDLNYGTGEKSNVGFKTSPQNNQRPVYDGQGRFPANVICSDDALNDGVMTKGDNRKSKPTYDKGMWGNAKSVESTALYSDSGSKSRYFDVDVWGEKHGLLQFPKSAKKERLIYGFNCVKLDVWTTKKDENMEQVVSLVRAILGLVAPSLSIGGFGNLQTEAYPTDTISTIRTAINKITELKTWNLLIQQPTSESTLAVIKEVMAGINLAEFAVSEKELTERIGIFLNKDIPSTEDVKNATYQSLLKIKEQDAWQDAYSHHPTHKPVHLMSWLVRLVSKEGDTVLDPFAGSFTTGVACKMLGRNFIGIEMDAYYCAIGKARMDAVKTPQPNLFDEKELI